MKHYVVEMAAAKLRPGIFDPRPKVAAPAVFLAVKPGARQVSATGCFQECTILKTLSTWKAINLTNTILKHVVLHMIYACST